jgi:hypothetical protein
MLPTDLLKRLSVYVGVTSTCTTDYRILLPIFYLFPFLSGEIKAIYAGVVPTPYGQVHYYT